MRPLYHHRPSFITPVCCVPANAHAATSQLRASVHAALLRGRPNMLIDVLVQSVRREARTFDALVHSTVVAGICRSVGPALRTDAPGVLLVMAGTRAALDAQEYFGQEEGTGEGVDEEGDEWQSAPPPPVEIVVLGAGGVRDGVGAVVVVDPPGKGEAIMELRKLVREASAARRPVLVLNHPQPGSIHEIAQCVGDLPLELARFEHVFTIAPFALRVREGAQAGLGVGQFVLSHAFPGKWSLWRVRQEGREGDVEKVDVPGTVDALMRMVAGGKGDEENKGDKRDGESYALCQSWDRKPSEEELLSAVTRATRLP